MSAAASGAPLLSVSSLMSRHQLRLFVPSLLQQCGQRYTRYSGLGCMELAALLVQEHLWIVIPTEMKSCTPCSVFPSTTMSVCTSWPLLPCKLLLCQGLAAAGCSDLSAPLECQMQMMDREGMVEFRLQTPHPWSSLVKCVVCNTPNIAPCHVVYM